MKTTLNLLAAGLFLAAANSALATVHYVSLESTNPSPPYATWATAATNIQDAVDAAVADEEIVVTNGRYATGGGRVYGYATNCVAVDKPLTVRSVNGPEATIIDGLGAMRCAYLSNDAVLVGFTLTRGYVGGFSLSWGGGACGGTLYNCTLSGNWVAGEELSFGYRRALGGGADGCTLNNCTLTGNSSTDYGGGAARCTLYNCTLTGNSATGAYGWGGGAYSSTLYNCIVCCNTADQAANYDSACTLNYCCTTPLAPGAGNISADPRLTDSAHVSSDSPCVGAGSSNYNRGTDVDGEAWANPPSIGCDEFHAGAVTGPLTVTTGVNYTNAVAGFALHFTAQLNGRALVNFWDFDDGTFAINEAGGFPHSFATPGDYTVTLWAHNDSHPGGVSASLVIHVDNCNLYYVSAASQNPVAPYTSWTTAATNIQDAVDAAVAGGSILVTNGTYASGGRATPDWTTNRVLLDKPVTLCSANGAQFTIIDGEQAMRCAYLAYGAGIIGFTMTNGTANAGGGVWSDSTGVVSNCAITANSAIGTYSAGGGARGGTLYDCTLTSNSAGYGGGALGCRLYNCTLTGNSAGEMGGGARGGTLYNCTLTGNSVGWFGGGAEGCTLNNCIVYYNTAEGGSDYDFSSTVNYCCATWLSTNGVGNITNAPLFVDYAGGNLRLQSKSPCINAGNNAYAPPGPELDGNPRIVSGTADIGAYEFQGTGSLISYAWLQQFGLPTDGTADSADTDADGLNNGQEWRAGTDPTKALSALRMLSAIPDGPGVAVRWQSIKNRSYFLQQATNIGAPLVFLTVQSNLVGNAGTTTYTDTNGGGTGAFFYRVGVQ
jgi:hypothetical protein